MNEFFSALDSFVWSPFLLIPVRTLTEFAKIAERRLLAVREEALDRRRRGHEGVLGASECADDGHGAGSHGQVERGMKLE